MNMLKGFDRIFVIIAILSILPAGIIAFKYGKNLLRKHNPEYWSYREKIEKQVESELGKMTENEMLAEAKERNLFYMDKAKGFLSLKNVLHSERRKDLMSNAPNEWLYPSKEYLVMVSILFCLFQAITLFFIMKFIARTIKWVSDGFKGETSDSRR